MTFLGLHANFGLQVLRGRVGRTLGPGFRVMPGEPELSDQSILNHVYFTPAPCSSFTALDRFRGVRKVVMPPGAGAEGRFPDRLLAVCGDASLPWGGGMLYRCDRGAALHYHARYSLDIDQQQGQQQGQPNLGSDSFVLVGMGNLSPASLGAPAVLPAVLTSRTLSCSAVLALVNGAAVEPPAFMEIDTQRFTIALLRADAHVAVQITPTAIVFVALTEGALPFKKGRKFILRKLDLDTYRPPDPLRTAKGKKLHRVVWKIQNAVHAGAFIVLSGGFQIVVLRVERAKGGVKWSVAVRSRLLLDFCIAGIDCAYHAARGAWVVAASLWDGGGTRLFTLKADGSALEPLLTIQADPADSGPLRQMRLLSTLPIVPQEHAPGFSVGMFVLGVRPLGLLQGDGAWLFPILYGSPPAPTPVPSAAQPKAKVKAKAKSKPKKKKSKGSDDDDDDDEDEEDEDEEEEEEEEENDEDEDEDDGEDEPVAVPGPVLAPPRFELGARQCLPLGGHAIDISVVSPSLAGFKDLAPPPAPTPAAGTAGARKAGSVKKGWEDDGGKAKAGKAPPKKAVKKKAADSDDDDDEDDEDEDEDEDEDQSSKKKGKGAKPTKAPPKKAGKKKMSDSEEDDEDDDDEDDDDSTKKKGKGNAKAQAKPKPPPASPPKKAGKKAVASSPADDDTSEGSTSSKPKAKAGAKVGAKAGAKGQAGAKGKGAKSTKGAPPPPPESSDTDEDDEPGPGLLSSPSSDDENPASAAAAAAAAAAASAAAALLHATSEAPPCPWSAAVVNTTDGVFLLHIHSSPSPGPSPDSVGKGEEAAPTPPRAEWSSVRVLLPGSLPSASLLQLPMSALPGGGSTDCFAMSSAAQQSRAERQLIPATLVRALSFSWIETEASQAPCTFFCLGAVQALVRFLPRLRVTLPGVVQDAEVVGDGRVAVSWRQGAGAALTQGLCVLDSNSLTCLWRSRFPSTTAPLLSIAPGLAPPAHSRRTLAFRHSFVTLHRGVSNSVEVSALCLNDVEQSIASRRPSVVVMGGLSLPLPVSASSGKGPSCRVLPCPVGRHALAVLSGRRLSVLGWAGSSDDSFPSASASGAAGTGGRGKTAPLFLEELCWLEQDWGTPLEIVSLDVQQQQSAGGMVEDARTRVAGRLAISKALVGVDVVSFFDDPLLGRLLVVSFFWG